MIGGLRLVCIVDSRDYYTTVCRHFLLAEDKDLLQEFESYQGWRKANFALGNDACEDMEFTEWLVAGGAREATEQELPSVQIDV